MKRGILLVCCLVLFSAGAEAQPSNRRLPSRCSAGVRVITAYYWEGRSTASGQHFNANGLTAAHRALPFGTRLAVMNPRNGKSVTVTVNDRGPFVRGVALDLSLGAAKVIGMRGTGAVCMARLGTKS